MLYKVISHSKDILLGTDVKTFFKRYSGNQVWSHGDRFEFLFFIFEFYFFKQSALIRYELHIRVAVNKAPIKAASYSGNNYHNEIFLSETYLTHRKSYM